MKVIAQRGTSQYLLVEEDFDQADLMAPGWIADEAMAQRTGPFPVQAILARGYWEEYEAEGTPGEAGELERLLRLPLREIKLVEPGA